MKRIDKEPFESLSEEQLKEMEQFIEEPLTDERMMTIKNRVKREIENENNEKEEKVVPMKKRGNKRYMWVAAASFMLLVGFGMRDEIKIAYQRAFGTEGEQLLKQVDSLDEVAEDQGLRLTAKNSFKDGDTTYVMMTLQDLEGERLAKDTQIDAWEMLNGGNTRVVDYNEKTKTAVLLTSAISWEEHENQGFLLRRFKSHEQESTNQVALDWDKLIQPQPEWEKLKVSDGIGGGYRSEALDAHKLDFDELASQNLKPGVLNQPLDETEQIILENAAYKDGLLHLLVRYPNDFQHDYLDVTLNNEGKAIESIASFNAGRGTHRNETGRTDFIEFVFDVKEDTLKKAQLSVETRSMKDVVEGNWAIRLAEPTALKKQELSDVALTSHTQFTQLSFSGLSLTGMLTSDTTEEIPVELIAVLKDGSKKTLIAEEDQVVLNSEDADQSLMFNYISLEEVQTLYLNGKELPLSN